MPLRALKVRLAAVVLAAGALFGAHGAQAQGIPVYDNTSFLELVNQLNQGAQQLENMEGQLNAQLQMLKSLPSSILAPVGQLAQGTQQLMGNIQNIEDMGANLQGELTSLYPTSFNSSNPQAIIDQIAAMTAANRQAINTSMELQNQVAANAPQLQVEVSSAVSASDGAGGMTAVGQATNQILAAQSQQLGDLQAIMIADQRTTEQQALQQQSETAAANAFNDGYIPQPQAQSW